MPEKFRWTLEELARLPEKAGLYTAFESWPGRSVFEGRSNNLRQRVLQHYFERDLGFLPAYVEVTHVSDHVWRARQEKERNFRNSRPRDMRPESS